ncbi:hypothetical protein [Halolamina rubra]|uniref:hypothetical protein n=1 Tax=Halolamina rubra TaxID=1380430 RepID=UPI000678E2EC|nr:hypothetical protein [Halolamina rubra]
MATQSPQSSRKAGEFSIDLRDHGFSDGPAQVLVEISPVRRGVLMAVLAAGADGRYSFDFRFTDGEIDILRAYVEGMRESVDGLPEWIKPVREEIEQHLTDHETSEAPSHMAMQPETDGGEDPDA